MLWQRSIMSLVLGCISCAHKTETGQSVTTLVRIWAPVLRIAGFLDNIEKAYGKGPLVIEYIQRV